MHVIICIYMYMTLYNVHDIVQCTCQSLSLASQTYFVCNNMPQTIFNPPSQFSRLGIQVSLAIICLFVWAMVGWVALPFFSLFKLMCYAHVFPCTMYMHAYHLVSREARAGKNTSGNYCHISRGVAGILAPPIRLQD